MTTQDLSQFIPCGITSTVNQQAKQFSELMVEYCEQNNLFESLQELESTSKADWTSEDHNQLKLIDQLFYASMLVAECKCHCGGLAPWSPDLHKAYALH
jgi:hypothetical protein